MPWVQPTNQRHIFVRIRGDNHDNHDYIVDSNRCMNSGYRPSLVSRPTKFFEIYDLSVNEVICLVYCLQGACHSYTEGLSSRQRR